MKHCCYLCRRDCEDLSFLNREGHKPRAWIARLLCFVIPKPTLPRAAPEKYADSALVAGGQGPARMSSPGHMSHVTSGQNVQTLDSIPGGGDGASGIR